MRYLKSKLLLNGKTRVTVDLEHNEHVVVQSDNEKYMKIDLNKYYRTGYPSEFILRGETIFDSIPLYWCEFEQKWIDAT